MWYHTRHSLNIRIIKKLYLTVQKGALCTHVTSSAASRDSAAKLATDSYQFWVAHENLRVTFQSHIRFARKVQNMVVRFQSPLVYLFRNELNELNNTGVRMLDYFINNFAILGVNTL